MHKKNLIVTIAAAALFVALGIAYVLYRPDWQVPQIVREGELSGQTIQTITAARTFSDFTFSPTMNGLTTYIADLPTNANIISLHVRLREMFVGADEAMPSLQFIIQNDDGTACALDIGNVPDEIQLIASHKLCTIGQRGSLFVRDASAMPAFSTGALDVFASYIVF